MLEHSIKKLLYNSIISVAIFRQIDDNNQSGLKTHKQSDFENVTHII